MSLPTYAKRGNVLVTGAAGFLGSHLVDLLLQDGRAVHGRDNLLTGRLENLAGARGSGAFEFIDCDVTQTLAYAADSLDALFHLASPASPLDYARWPLATLRVGAAGTDNGLKLATAHRAVFVLASTSEVYGDPLVHPQEEDYWGNVNPVGARSCYDEAKRYAEALTAVYGRAGAPVRIARIFNTYGPRMRHYDGRAVPTFIRQALAGEPITVFGNGTQTRSLCYVSDTVEALWRLWLADCSAPVNIGNPEEVTMLSLAQLIRSLAGSTSEIRFEPLPTDDPVRRKPEIGRAQKELDWNPRVGLEEGLSLTIASYVKEGGPGETDTCLHLQG